MADLSLHFRAGPDADPNGAVERFIMALTAQATDTLEEIRPTAHGMEICLYPTAAPLRLWWHGGIRIDTETLEMGPGYHRYVDRVCRASASEAGLMDAPAAATDSAALADSADSIDAAAIAHCADLARRIRAGEAPRQIGLYPLTLHHEHAAMTPDGPRDDAWLAQVGEGDDEARGLLESALPWWRDDATDSAAFLLSRARAQMTALVPDRPPQTETEMDRLATLCDDLDAGYVKDPSLDWPFAAWRAVLAHLDGLREVPRHLRDLAPSSELFFRRGRVRVAGPRPVYFTMPATMLGAFREDGSYWACDDACEIFVQVGEVERPEDVSAPPADVVLDNMGDWSREAIVCADRRHEWETDGEVQVLHGAAVLHKGSKQYVAAATFQVHGPSRAGDADIGRATLAAIFESISTSPHETRSAAR